MIVTAPSLFAAPAEQRKTQSPRSHYPGAFQPSVFDEQLVCSSRLDKLAQSESSSYDDRASDRTYKSHYVGGGRESRPRSRRGGRYSRYRGHHRPSNRAYRDARDVPVLKKADQKKSHHHRDYHQPRSGVMTRSQARNTQKPYSPPPPRKYRDS